MTARFVRRRTNNLFLFGSGSGRCCCSYGWLSGEHRGSRDGRRRWSGRRDGNRDVSLRASCGGFTCLAWSDDEEAHRDDRDGGANEKHERVDEGRTWARSEMGRERKRGRIRRGTPNLRRRRGVRPGGVLLVLLCVVVGLEHRALYLHCPTLDLLARPAMHFQRTSSWGFVDPVLGKSANQQSLSLFPSARFPVPGSGKIRPARQALLFKIWMLIGFAAGDCFPSIAGS